MLTLLTKRFRTQMVFLLCCICLLTLYHQRFQGRSPLSQTRKQEESRVLGPISTKDFAPDAENVAEAGQKGVASIHGPLEVDSWIPPVVPAYLQQADQYDPELIAHIRDLWLIPPFPRGQWTLSEPELEHFSQEGQSQAVAKALGPLKGGFFIECGAADGQHFSNTLFFERSRNWTGLLVEVSPPFFSKLTKVRRNAYMINACISPGRRPMVLNYTQADLMGGLNAFMSDSHQRVIKHNNYVTGWRTVQCFPLASILKAIGVTHVDYFSLDVEGAELEILENIPFDQFDITTFTIEFLIQADYIGTQRKLKAIRELMVDKHGYREVAILQNLDILLMKEHRTVQR